MHGGMIYRLDGLRPDTLRAEGVQVVNRTDYTVWAVSDRPTGKYFLYSITAIVQPKLS